MNRILAFTRASLIPLFLLAAAGHAQPPREATLRFAWEPPKTAPPDGCAVTPPSPKGTATPGEVQGSPSPAPATAGALPQNWPAQFQLPDSEKPNFAGEIKPRLLKAGTAVFRVIGSGGNPEGGYWSSVLPPAKEADWRASNAVFSYWNGASCLEQYRVPKNHPVYVWEGQAGPQTDTERAGFYLPGGGPQYFIPASTSQLNGVFILYAPIHWAQ